MSCRVFSAGFFARCAVAVAVAAAVGAATPTAAHAVTVTPLSGTFLAGQSTSNAVNPSLSVTHRHMGFDNVNLSQTLNAAGSSYVGPIYGNLSGTDYEFYGAVLPSTDAAYRTFAVVSNSSFSQLYDKVQISFPTHWFSYGFSGSGSARSVTVYTNPISLANLWVYERRSGNWVEVYPDGDGFYDVYDDTTGFALVFYGSPYGGDYFGFVDFQLPIFSGVSDVASSSDIRQQTTDLSSTDGSGGLDSSAQINGKIETDLGSAVDGLTALTDGFTKLASSFSSGVATPLETPAIDVPGTSFHVDSVPVDFWQMFDGSTQNLIKTFVTAIFVLAAVQGGVFMVLHQVESGTDEEPVGGDSE